MQSFIDVNIRRWYIYNFVNCHTFLLFFFLFFVFVFKCVICLSNSGHI